MDIKSILLFPHKVVMKLQCLEFIAPLAIRIFLVPVFFVAGMNKISNIDEVAQWFGSGLGLPMPLFFAYAATLTELVGAFCLAFGFATRYIVIPLICVMFVAIFTVHIDNGWAAIAGSQSASAERLSNLLSWLQEHYPMRYKYATELGMPVILNNGIQFAVTYIVMLFTLFFTGGGRYISADYWISRFFCPAVDK